MIRFILGLIVVMGAVGGMEDPANNLLACMALACVGLAVMAYGVENVRYE